MQKYWVTQTSLDCTSDERLLSLMEKSGCIGVFLGIETVSASNLRSVRKAHSLPSKQRSAIRKLHDHGIAVMAGFLVGFDTETPTDVVAVADAMEEIGIDVPFISVLTPFGQTALREDLAARGGLIEERGWEYYNGYNVTYRPSMMSPRQLELAHRELWDSAFSPGAIAKRIVRGTRHLRVGALALTTTMNGYYGLKQLKGTGPRLPEKAIGFETVFEGA
jgi:radical SAM superfamily enzyme YgiQ (UPF0313 family)